MTVDVAVRMGLQGGSQVSKTLQEVGRDGQRSLRQIREAAKELPPHLRVVSAGIGQMKDGVDDLVSRTGSLGGAVAGLGPVGMALTATFAAVAAGAVVAVQAARDLMTFAADLQDASDAVGVNTEKLQTWRFAMEEAGGEAQNLDAGLAGLNTTIGAVRTGLGDAKQLEALTELGLDPAVVKSWSGLEEALPAIIEAFAGVTNEADRTRLAQRLNIEALLPLLRLAAGEFGNLESQIAGLGVVIDDSVVKQLDEANRRIEVASIKTRANLAPALVFAAEAMAGMSEATAGLIGWLTGFDSKIDESENRVSIMQNRLRLFIGDAAAAAAAAGLASISPPPPPPPRNPNWRRIRGGSNSGRTAEIERNRAARAAASAPPPAPRPSPRAAPVRAPRAAGSRRDPEAERRREAEARERVEDQLARVREASLDSERDLAEAMEVVNEARRRGILATDAERDALAALLAARLADAKTLEALDGIYDGLESSTRAYIEATQAELGSREAATAGHAINLELLADERAALYEAAGLTEDYAQAMGLSKEALDALRAPLDENIAGIIRAQRAYAAGEIDLAALTEQTLRYGRALDGATQASQRQIEAAQQVEGLRRGNETPEERMARELRELDALRTASSGGPGAMTQADYDRERRRIEDDARRAREGTDAARIRDQIATPEQRRDRERAELDRIYRDSQGAPGAMTEDEYARAGKAIEDSYLRAAEAIRGATLEQRILNGVLDQSINSGEDLLRVILEWVKAQAMLALRNPEGQGGSFLDRFLGNLGSNGTSGGGFSIPGFGGGSKQVGGAGGGLGALAGVARNAASVFSSIFGGGRQYGGLAPAGHAMSMFETGGEIIRLPRDGHVLGVSATDRLLSGGLAQQAQAQADAMAMAAMIGRGAGGGSMSVNARIINGTGVAASASVTATDNGRGGLDLEVDIQRLVDARVDRRIGQMGRGRDDAMLAGRFGLKPRLQGG
jgi:hypothetical protein